MNSLSILLIALFLSSQGFAVTTWEQQNRKPGLTPPEAEVLLVKEINLGHSGVMRLEILEDGLVFESVLRRIDSFWKVQDRRKVASLPADMVKTLAAIKRDPTATGVRVVVPRNPACDSSDAAIFVKNLETNEFEQLYHYTSECGQNDLQLFRAMINTRTVVSLFDFLEGVDHIQ